MNIALTFITGTATGAILMITTTFPRNSIKKQAEDLRKEYRQIEEQHEHFVEKVLPMIPLAGNEKGTDALGTGKTKSMLRLAQLKLLHLENKISCEGTYQVGLKEDIEDLAEALKDLRANNLAGTTAAKIRLNLLKDPDMQRQLFGDENAGNVSLTIRVEDKTPDTGAPDV